MNHPRVPAAVACTVLSVVLVAGCTSSESVPTNEGSRAAEGGSSTTDVPSESTTTSPETDSSPDVLPSRAFSAFAEGDDIRIPWANETTLYFNGEKVAQLDARRAARRGSWSICPAGSDTYEGRACPVSVLDTIRAANRRGRTTSIEVESPTVVGCNQVRPPSDVVGNVTGWIRPNQDRDCFGDFAIAVYVNAADEISAINFVLSGP